VTFILGIVLCAAEVRSDGQLLIHFDGWTDHYDYWTDPSTKDIHPIGWFDQCGKNYQNYKQQLQAPKGDRHSARTGTLVNVLQKTVLTII